MGRGRGPGGVRAAEQREVGGQAKRSRAVRGGRAARQRRREKERGTKKKKKEKKEGRNGKEEKEKERKERKRERDSRRHRRSVGHARRLGARERDARVEGETVCWIRVSGLWGIERSGGTGKFPEKLGLGFQGEISSSTTKQNFSA